MSTYPRPIYGRNPDIFGWDRGYSRHMVINRSWWTEIGSRGKWKLERTRHPAHQGLKTLQGRRKQEKNRVKNSAYNAKITVRNRWARFKHVSGRIPGSATYCVSTTQEVTDASQDTSPI